MAQGREHVGRGTRAGEVACLACALVVSTAFVTLAAQAGDVALAVPGGAVVAGLAAGLFALARRGCDGAGTPAGRDVGSGLPVPPSAALAPSPDGASGAADEPSPTDQAGPTRPGAPATLDLPALSRRLAASEDPIAELKLTVGDIRTREARAAHPEEGISSEPAEAPCGMETYLAHALEEAGLFSDDVGLPALRVVKPRRSGLFYLRPEESDYPYLAKLRIIRLESALNRVHFASVFFDDLSTASEEDAYRLNQNLASSITAQLAKVPEGMPTQGEEDPDGEWAVRKGIATGIETFQLPYRLTADFRSNVAGGAVAIRVNLTPAEAFPASWYSEELGRVIPATSAMRRQWASAYGLRLGILLAACAFRCTERVRHVFVAGVLDTATSHECDYSVDFDRERFGRIDLEHVGDPFAAYEEFGATMDVEDGALSPVRPSFSLEDELFCPSRRYDEIELSARPLDELSARVLGTTRVSGLSINEDAKRELVASDIARNLTASTERNVRMILRLAGDDPDPTVRSAAERTVSKLIAGTLPEENALAVEDEFVEGDDLSRAVERSVRLLGRKEVGRAAGILEGALGPIDAAGTYADTEAVDHRSFKSYAERALYNRMFARRGAALELVPDAYYDAHLLLSTALIEQSRIDDALAHARRALELNPLDDRAHLRVVRCEEMLGHFPAAIEQLGKLLAIAHDPETLGVAYYRMAFMQWKEGNLLAAEASYRKCMQFVSSSYPLAMVELKTLAQSTPSVAEGDMTDGQVDGVLLTHGIPVAPTEGIGDALLGCTRASLDSEVFPVARNFATLLGALSGDDVVYDIIRSIELEPDR